MSQAGNQDCGRPLYDAANADRATADDLLPLVYDQLRKLASDRLAREQPGQTLQATALVHEAFLRLSKNGTVQWDGRSHYFGAAAEAMRRILVDRARQKNSQKRGGNRKRFALEDVWASVEQCSGDLLDLDDALQRFESEDPVKCQLVTLRFFMGLTLDQAANELGISPATADRHWAYAKAWLYDALSAGESPKNSRES